jgi:hypothetical protein
MGIRFKCHHCQASLNIKAELANKRGVCPQCHGRFRIPANSQKLSLALDDNALKPSIPSSHGAPSDSSTTKQQEIQPRLPSQATKTDSDSDTPRSELPASEPLYFVRPPSGGEYGPANKETIELWISQRRITGETLICQVGLTQWKKAREVFTGHFVLG